MLLFVILSHSCPYHATNMLPGESTETASQQQAQYSQYSQHFVRCEHSLAQYCSEPRLSVLLPFDEPPVGMLRTNRSGHFKLDRPHPPFRYMSLHVYSQFSGDLYFLKFQVRTAKPYGFLIEKINAPAGFQPV